MQQKIKKPEKLKNRRKLWLLISYLLKALQWNVRENVDEKRPYPISTVTLDTNLTTSCSILGENNQRKHSVRSCSCGFSVFLLGI